MILRFVLENAPHPQLVSEKEFAGGRLVIGRGADADWQIDDPDQFVSRSHAIITEESGRIMVTDASSGGLYVDNAANPVGAGNSVPIDAGMRLRLGDFVLRLEEVTVRKAQGETPRGRSGAGVFSFEFGSEEITPAPKKRPDSLPDPFGLREDNRDEGQEREEARPPRPLDQDDPFDLDLRGALHATSSTPSEDPSHNEGFGSYFSDAPVAKPVPSADTDFWQPDVASDTGRNRTRGEPHKGTESQPPQAAAPPLSSDPFGLSGEAAAQSIPPVQEPEPVRTVTQPSSQELEQSQSALPETSHHQPTAAKIPSASTANDAALRAAFFRGMGLDPAHMPPADTEEEMERIGRCLRLLVEGVMALLRTRAEEKNRVRVAQTIIASANVNPLKFLATTEDGLAALLQPRGEGYLAPEDAVNWAFRDLNDHQVRTWTALQTALRRMIDSFDPDEIEREMQDAGLMEKLLAGGSSAKMWQLYVERYSEIARAAEERFLGEVGADFRDAYENQGRS
ncbi:type VI secretion system-associated FHA domain protein TagH [Shimia sagamensis]|uniref:FHA domain protein n=1 Tax=Shimia sagamensis TaxID=1566352 RepID=A0ABY1PJJ7_9RHOB|nr:type VI secretion system-associated FHA domain protein TagH [Shimia sagamensis]SMP34735.1 FHA domain protein [Shimia sagamensis]